jgi:hypothetical protein
MDWRPKKKYDDDDDDDDDNDDDNNNNNNNNNNKYILATQTRTLTCYMTDPSSRRGGCPTTNKTASVLTTAKIWS